MKHYLLVAKEDIPSVRLCGKAQLEHLAAEGKLTFDCRPAKKVKKEELNRADAVIFIRAADEAELLLARLCQKIRKPCAYVLDDDLLNVPPEVKCADYYNNIYIQANIREIMACCDALFSPNRLLLEKYGPGFSRTARFDEPSPPAGEADGQPCSTVKVGFAGSPDRSANVEALLQPVIRRVLAGWGDRVSFEFFGIAPAFAEELGIKCLPFCSYDEYRNTMQRLYWDIALAPMPEGEFYRCKYFNKYTEYAAFGAAGIYSSVEPYTLAVRNEENGLLCANTEDAWYSALCRLLDDAGLRAELARNARCEAAGKYSLPSVSAVWETELAALAEKSGSGGRVKSMPCIAVRSAFRKIKRKL